MLMLLLLCGSGVSSWGEDSTAKLEAILIWGTNDPAPNDPALKPVDPRTARKLGKLPFKWKSYYEVKRVAFEVAPGKRRRVTLSEECEILVRTVEGDTVELALRGKGKPVGKVTQSLPLGQDLVTGGNAENLSAWFVVLRRTE
jgi:hypothetical protein